MSLVRGDAVSLPLADESVDLIVTSPPYFALRSYTDGGEHYDGQIGSEDTPAAFLEALWAVTAECKRVLKPSGSMWVNLGDKYGDKSLMGLPWRYAIGCIDNLGLILRAEVVWSKPNGLPESVTDRVRRSHEQWFMFTKEP
ncbi:MAG: site-specific DNA-methyltransferase, partial [Rhodospirillaceae bacterium]